MKSYASPPLGPPVGAIPPFSSYPSFLSPPPPQRAIPVGSGASSGVRQAPPTLPLPPPSTLPNPTPPPLLMVSSPRFGIKNGYTALIEASCEGHLAVVEALLAKGADREAKTKVRAPEAHPPL